MRAFVQRNPVITFVLLTLGFQFGLVLLVGSMMAPGQRLEEVPAAHMIFRFRIFAPLVFVVAVTWYIEGRAGLRKLFGSLFNWRIPGKWYALAFTWKFLIAWAGVALMCLLTDLTWPGFFCSGFWINYLKTLPFTITVSIIEETAWVRFCVTRLQMRFKAFWSALIIGNLWGFWYLPMLLIGEGVPAAYPVPVFQACMISMTILFTWVFNTTRSGTVLIIMQIISNSVFMMVYVLPDGSLRPDGTPELRYLIGYSYMFVAVAAILTLVVGVRNLSRNQRVRWDDKTLEPVPATPDLEGSPLTPALAMQLVGGRTVRR